MSLSQKDLVLASWRNAENSLQSVNLTMPFNVQRHLISRKTLRQFRNQARGLWQTATAAA